MAQLNVKATVGGVQDVMDRLMGLSSKVSGKIARSAVAKGTRPIAREAKALVHRRSGALRRSITTRVRTYADRNTVGIVGPKAKAEETYKGKTIKPDKYAHLLEGGRKAVQVITKKVLSTGKPPQGQKGETFGTRAKAYAGSRFLKQAFDKNLATSQATIAQELAAGLARVQP